MKPPERHRPDDAPEPTGLRPLGIALALAVAAGSTVGVLGWTLGRDLLKLRIVEARWSLQFEYVSQRVLVHDERTGSVLALWIAVAVVVAHLVFTLSVSLLSAKAPEAVDGKLHVVCFRCAPPRWSWAYAAVVGLAIGCWLVSPSQGLGVLSLSAQTMLALIIALSAWAGARWFTWLLRVSRVNVVNRVGILAIGRGEALLSSLYVSGRSLLCVGPGGMALARLAGGFSRASWHPAVNLLASSVDGPYRVCEGEEAAPHQASPPPWKLGGTTARWMVGGAALTTWILLAVAYQIGRVPRAQGGLLFWLGLVLALVMTLSLVPAGFSPWIYISSGRLRARSWLWTLAATRRRPAPLMSSVAAAARCAPGPGELPSARGGFGPPGAIILTTGWLAVLVAFGACLFSGYWLVQASGWVMACGMFAALLFVSTMKTQVLLAFRDGSLRVCVRDVWLPVTAVDARHGAAILSVGPLEIAVRESGHFLESAQPAETSRNRLMPACAPLSEFTLSSREATARG